MTKQEDIYKKFLDAIEDIQGQKMALRDRAIYLGKTLDEENLEEVGDKISKAIDGFNKVRKSLKEAEHLIKKRRRKLEREVV